MHYRLDVSFKQWCAIIFSLQILGGGCWWYFLYRPLTSYIFQEQAEIDLYKNQLHNSDDLQEVDQKLQASCNALQDTYSSLVSSLNLDPHQIADALLAYADTCKLNLVTYEITTSDMDKNVLLATYLFTGTYQRISQLLEWLENSQYRHGRISYHLQKDSEEQISCVLHYEFSKIGSIVPV